MNFASVTEELAHSQSVRIDIFDLRTLDFWFEYVGSQSKCSQVDSVVSSSIVMI